MPKPGDVITIIKLLDGEAIKIALALSMLGFSYQFIMLRLQLMGYYIPERDPKTGELEEIIFY